MKTALRRTALAGSSMAILAGAVVAGTTTEAAATPRVNVCGSSYVFLKSWPIKALSWTDDAGRTKGFIDTYWSNSTGKNCAIARPKDGVSAWQIRIKIGKNGSGWTDIDGYNGANYKRYAGPVYVKAPRCINVAGGFTYSGAYGEHWEAWSEYSGKHCG